MSRLTLTAAVLAGLCVAGCIDSSRDSRDLSTQETTTVNQGPVLSTNDLADLGIVAQQDGSNNVLLLDLETLEPIIGIKPIVLSQDGAGNVLAISLRKLIPEPEPDEKEGP